MSPGKMLLFGGVLAAAGVVWWPLLGGGDRSAPVRDDERPVVHFVDSKSGDVFPMRSTETVETHPRTGEKSLFPGLYCAKCDKWRIAPNPETIQSNPAARLCPVHREPMVLVRPDAAP